MEKCFCCEKRVKKIRLRIVKICSECFTELNNKDGKENDKSK